ncbi:hypothetical protein [Endozoicomonas sp. G2_2]|uniref:hypothetical protein n=1 Tax=Endozoicomonas sp. G2_2 TaxID=2821092 RepID=UPI001AD9782E|nr:hypothetical protein [Endozoicomonas sp. G2_2]
MSYVLVLVTSPTFWACYILMALLIPSVAGMVFKPVTGTTKKQRAYRATGIEFALVFLPFAVVGIANGINGTFAGFLASPELPVAAMVAASLALLHIIRADLLRRVEQPHKPVILIGIACLVMAVSIALIVFLVTTPEITSWVAVFNAAYTSVALVLMYGFAAAAAAF